MTESGDDGYETEEETEDVIAEGQVWVFNEEQIRRMLERMTS